MPQFHPLNFVFPNNPQSQVMNSLDSYTNDEINWLKNKNKTGFINVIRPNTIKERSPALVRRIWEKFILKKWYQKQLKPLMYFYEISTKTDQYNGFLGGIQTDDFKKHKITIHEKTFPKRIQLMAEYLEKVQIQAEPVVIIHENNLPDSLNPFILKQKPCDIVFDFEGYKHQLWTLSKVQEETLKNWAKKEKCFHLADGHHRIECMNYLSDQIKKPLNISSFLLHQSQIQLQAFIWFLEDSFKKETKLQIEHLIIQNKGDEIFLSEFINNDLPLVMKLNDKYFGFKKLNLNTENIPAFIHNKLLGGFPEIKQKMKYLPQDKNSFNQVNSNEMIFLMKPLSKKFLFENAKTNKTLPQKSTYILPKMLTGMAVSSVY